MISLQHNYRNHALRIQDKRLQIQTSTGRYRCIETIDIYFIEIRFLKSLRLNRSTLRVDKNTSPSINVTGVVIEQPG